MAKATKTAPSRKGGAGKSGAKKKRPAGKPKAALGALVPPPSLAGADASPAVLDRLWSVITSRRDADPEVSHSARLLSRGTAKIAQKFGEEAVECLIEAALKNRDALVAESADVLYHLIVMWVDAGVTTGEVWAELQRREGLSGIAEKASRPRQLPIRVGVRTKKIP
jgi:phosphoribosyl-ATP pyrophosphohydrolase